MELSILMGLLGILGLWVSPLVLTGTRTATYLPHVSQVNQGGHDLLNTIIEGNQTGSTTGFIPGLRFSKGLQLGGPNEVQFLVYLPQVPQATCINLRWNSALNRMERRVGVSPCSIPLSGAAAPVPYYTGEGLTVLPVASDPIFRFWDVLAGGGESELFPTCGGWLCSPASVDRVDVKVQVQTGNGDTNFGNARLIAASSVALRIP